jgi:hypothetical protein
MEAIVDHSEGFCSVVDEMTASMLSVRELLESLREK